MSISHVKEYPLPPGFNAKEETLSTQFKWWGRHTTHLASDGTIPSERWDNTDIQSENVVAGYLVNIGTRITHDYHKIAGISRTEIQEAKEHEVKFKNKVEEPDTDDGRFFDCGYAEEIKSGRAMKKGGDIDDQTDLKFRGDSHSKGKGGWYIPNITFREGEAQSGKEFPHPNTNHYSFQKPGQQTKFGSIIGKWIGFLAYCYNDKNGVPVNGLYINPNPIDEPDNYIFAGESRDTGNMKPGPVCKKIAQQGGGKQSLQIRIDSAPDVQIRNAFAVEIEPPN